MTWPNDWVAVILVYYEDIGHDAEYNIVWNELELETWIKFLLLQVFLTLI